MTDQTNNSDLNLSSIQWFPCFLGEKKCINSSTVFQRLGPIWIQFNHFNTLLFLLRGISWYVETVCWISNMCIGTSVRLTVTEPLNPQMSSHFTCYVLCWEDILELQCTTISGSECLATDNTNKCSEVAERPCQILKMISLMKCNISRI